MWRLSTVLRRLLSELKRPVSTYYLNAAIFHSQWARLEQELLVRRLKHVEAGYNRDLRCMEGTREFLLNKIITWATDGSAQMNRSNTYWIYGLPGIGKTSLAHSISERLHDQQRLAGAFFCRRDDPNLDKPRNILPTLIKKLAIMFPPFQTIVAERLRNDPNLTQESMKESFLLDLISSLPRHPTHTLVFIIDALDECGDALSRPRILRALTDAAAQAPWLRIVITSRPEVDIRRFFDGPAHSSHLRYDLTEDQEAGADLRTFAQREFNVVAEQWYLPTPWPEESLFENVISHANGLFIFVKTLVLALKHCKDPTESLKAALQSSAGTGLDSLYALYSSILKSPIAPGDEEFQRVIGVVLAAAPYRPLCRETIAEPAGEKPNLVRKWVDDLSSLLYEEGSGNKGIRVRHLSISDFFFTPGEYHVDLRNANIQLGIACLTTMIDQLRFNICKLEDSRLANADIKDLRVRIEQNISDALQYSCLYWSNHLCSHPKNDDCRVREQLRKFFEGRCPLFWIEVLSLMGMVPISVPSLRRVRLTWVKVSIAPAWGYFLFLRLF